MNFNKFEVYGKPTLQQGGWIRTGEGNAYIKYTNTTDPNYAYRICTLDYIPQHHPNQITITGIASKELEVSVLVLRSDDYIIASLGWQENGYTFNLGSTYDKIGIMFRFKNGDAITTNHVSFDIVGDWHNTPHYIHNTSTDTLTTLPAVLYPNAVTATVGLKGNMQQTGTPTPQNPVMPNGCGERTANLIDIEDISETVTVIYKDKFLMQSISEGTYTLSFNTTADVSHMVSVGVGTTGYSKDIKTISGVQNGYYTINFTISAEDSGKNLYVRFVRFGALTTVTYTVTNIMLNTGSTALPYEPYGVKIPILNNSQTTNVYLGEVQSTRKIKKLVLTGEETVAGSAVTGGWIITNLSDSINNTAGVQTAYCSHYEAKENGAMSGLSNGEMCISTQYNNRINFVTSFSSATDFQAYLAQQYAAGTPVCVWYVLATETTGIVNEPLRKIGTYADEVSGISIPTIAGANTLSVDTTLQPSEVTATYKGWHPVQSVHERENGAWD